MTFTTPEQLVTELTNNGYKQVSELLNTSNKNLFIGPNNLLDQDKIESARIFTKPIYTKDQLNLLYPCDEQNQRLWARSASIQILGERAIQYSQRNENSGPPISNHVVGVFKLGRNLTSHMHIVHGGAIASIIDEYFVKVVLPLTPDSFAVTANLNIKYLRPVKFEEHERTIDVLLDCFVVESSQGRKFTVKGALMDLQGNKYCIGEILVVVPREPL